MIPRGLLKEYSKPLSYLLRMSDVFAILLSGLIAYNFKFGDIQIPYCYQVALLSAALLTAVVFPIFKIYDSIRTKMLWAYILNLLQALASVLILLACGAFLTKTGELFSREWFFWWIVFSGILLLVFRCTLLFCLRIMRANHWNERRVIIIGASALGKNLAENLQQALWTGFRIVAIYDETAASKTIAIGNTPVLPLPDDIDKCITDLPETIDEVWLALPLSAESLLKKISHGLRHHTISIKLILDVFGFGLLKNTITDLAGFPALILNSTPMIGMNRIIKAIEDRIIAFFILVLISPLILLIATAVKLSSPGPVFFKQLRHGWDGKLIKIYKFRTMLDHQEEDKFLKQATIDDKRVTKLGKFLRKTSLDELPQFWNVLQGRMSIVGPRPHAISHNEYYKDSIKAYMQRHKVKPGITGWAQVNGWRGETDTLEKMEKRIEYDLYYIENWSLGFDLKIILLTLLQGFMNKNAY